MRSWNTKQESLVPVCDIFFYYAAVIYRRGCQHNKFQAHKYIDVNQNKVNKLKVSQAPRQLKYNSNLASSDKTIKTALIQGN